MLESSHLSGHFARTMNWNGGEGAYKVANSASTDVREQETTFAWESQLQVFCLEERMMFLTVFAIITVLAIIGNVLTLYVIFTRDQRLLFKLCLFSLAMSDLVFTIASGTSYLAKLARETSVAWTLGAFGCTIIPFAQTAAILIGSMSLVAIASDRYLAVLNKSKSKLLQTKAFCFSGLFIVWLTGFLISTPTLFAYDLEAIIAVPDEDHESFYKAYLCVTDTEKLSTYYIIVFIFIFAPTSIAFLCLNTILAKEIWKRRHAPGSQRRRQPKTKVSKRCSDKDLSTVQMKDTAETNTSSNGRQNSGKISSGESGKKFASTTKLPVFVVQPQPNIVETHRTERQKRQMRMFKVILLLMSVFICCRLPNWIFLLYKLTNEVTGKLNWLLLYSFGAMGILNCMLNPLLYTFLSETIRITAHIGSACYKFCRPCRRAKKTSHYANNQTLFNAANVQRKSDGGIYLGS